MYGNPKTSEHVLGLFLRKKPLKIFVVFNKMTTFASRLLSGSVKTSQTVC